MSLGGHRRAASRRRFLGVLISGCALATFISAPAVHAQPVKLKHLEAGKLPSLRERVPVNVVFVGLERNEVDAKKALKALPKMTSPIVRYPAFYGQTNPLGIRYTYDVDTHYTSATYERGFFGFLKKRGEKSSLTAQQTLYNNQTSNVLEIDKNYEIPASAVERRLALNPPRGVNTKQDTIFLIDWYGRKDFRFHVYTKNGEPTTDKNFDYGLLSYTKTVAWGGTTARDEETGLGATRRVWFYDFSAGPDSMTSNANVDNSDLDADGVADRRIPVAWEYSKKGFKDPKALSGDVGLLLRYVAIDLLFTPSPLYAPRIDQAMRSMKADLDLNFYDGLGASGASEMVKPAHLQSELGELLGDLKLSSDKQDLDFYEPQHGACFGAFTAATMEPTGQAGAAPPCTGETGFSVWASLYLHHRTKLGGILDDSKGYEVPSFNYLLPESAGQGCYAYADDDWISGKQTFVYFFLPSDGNGCARTYGWSDILIHEYGHHFGMSHPHDGYDSEEKRDFSGFEGNFQFAMAGTEVNSVMSYMHTNWDFSQFDHDNYDRWMTASYISASNDIVKSAEKEIPARVLRAADAAAGSAGKAFAGHSYRRAHAAAKKAFRLLSKAAPREAVIESLERDELPSPLQLSDRSVAIDTWNEDGLPIPASEFFGD